MLLAASLDAETTTEQFWDHYRHSSDALEGLRVHDPFMGGGSTLVEAARLGGTVSGTDVDATAVEIVSHCLSPGDANAVSEAGADLLGFLRTHFGALYPEDGGEPLHFFYVPIVTCPTCDNQGPLYRSLVLARDCKKAGAVVREPGSIVFDPETFDVFDLPSATQKTFKGSNRRWDVDRATYSKARYRCPACRGLFSHRDLRTGKAPTQLVAVERTPDGTRRTIGSPLSRDLESLDAALQLLDTPPVPVRIPTVEFNEDRIDPRPRSFGIERVQDLFTPRQLLVLGAAQAWLQAQQLDEPVDRALRLALSNALATNNRLCSYATDYGRLSALFSVRSYSMPALAVELNPLHTDSGRGTLQQCIRRIVASAHGRARRTYWDPLRDEPGTGEFRFETNATTSWLRCASAADVTVDGSIDVLMFDPPYYDYIIYDELAELFRAWDPEMNLGGVPLQSSIREDAGSFGQALADCLRPSLASRRPARPVAFTYHSSRNEAWEAIGTALDEAKLRVTALWPIRTDGHMGHHSHPGNCEWDVVVVCRPIQETVGMECPHGEDFWADHVGDFNVGDADIRNFSLAYSMAAVRFGQLAEHS